MSKEITRDEAWNLLCEWNQEPFHLRHADKARGAGPASVFNGRFTPMLCHRP